eukprot:CAMPEP_0181244106 /NCGR_PEP_ID=MMETSP1096-20121128/42664_1 /TAXON_ID=156174 ORGANISM="Chrysochromulina ericina, Strain CCMP281" /NCGR_SAMPLE_ID=MMETSP1096 /ASSEMBLY_ACC=CAM_ASM_000453 /LENGTH=68 /DNA_ID=CAMNT_0023340595 /DNA_START=8 /DNA_END=210 /DNA_ORIENTATION=+
MIILFAFHPFYPFLDACPGPDEDDPTCKGPTMLFTNAEKTLRALPLFVFSYTCHQNMINITNELADPS